MAKFNSRTVRPVTGKSHITTTGPAVNAEGGPGFVSDAKGELFRLAVVNFVGENTFYASGSDRDARFNGLVRQVALEDFEWLSGMLGWLRSGANMRSASLTGAAQAVQARIEAGEFDGNADLIDSVLQRADEPGEFIAYWQSQFDPDSLHTRSPRLPQAVRKGLERAVVRLYTERAFLKWDSPKRGVRFADVIELIHPTPSAEWQGGLFKHILDDRHHGDGTPTGSLPVLEARAAWNGLDTQRKLSLVKGRGASEALRAAGLTWENVLSDLGGSADKATLWNAIAPTMGLMALIRNLRNMDEAGIDRSVARTLAHKISDPSEVAASRLLPYRFLSAYLAAPSDRWKQPLTDALEESLKSVPSLPGRTLVLVDTSASMSSMGYSARSTVTPAMAGALLGVVFASRQAGDLYGFADDVFAHQARAGQGVLSQVTDFVSRIGEAGHGTEMTGALRATYKGHARVVIVSDMQCFADGGHSLADVRGYWSHRRAAPSDPIPVPSNIPVYGINLGGGPVTAIDTSIRNRHEFAGLTDQVFAQMSALEAGHSSTWPWLT